MNRLKRILIAAALTAMAPALRGDDVWTVTEVLSRRAVFSCSDFTMSSGTIDSAGISTNVAGNRGDVGTNGDIRLSGGALVNGNAVAGPGKNVSVLGNARVTGTTSNASVAEGCTPINLAGLAATLAASNSNATIPLTQKGNHALSGTDFSMSANDALALPAGTYYFTSFKLTGGATITLTGPTRILCTGRVDITGGGFVNPQPYRLRLWISGAGPFTLNGGATLGAFVYAPSAPANIAGASLTGGLFAAQVGISGPARVRRAIDDVAPRLAITSPAEGAVVSDPAHVLVKGTAFDDETMVSVTVNGQSATVNADGAFQITVDLTSTAVITAIATDLAGNSNTARVTVATTPPPVLTLSSPAPGSLVKTRTVDLSGGCGTATSVTVNGQAATITAGAWSLPSFDLGADGTHTLTIIATNAGGSTTITPSTPARTAARANASRPNASTGL